MRASPILLTATSVNSGAIPAATTAAFVNVAIPEGIKNTEKTGVLVSEIRVSLRMDPAIPSVVASANMSLRLGNDPLTAGFVPLSAVFPPLDEFAESFVNYRRDFILRLARPLYVAPSEVLAASFQFLNPDPTNGASADATVTLVGVQTPVLQRGVNRWIPYLASWQGPPTVAFSDYAVQTVEADLGNPFDVPMHVDRFIGRNVLVGVSGAAAGEGVFADALTNDLYVTVRDHLMRDVVRDPTPFNEVFHFTTRSWRVGTVVPSKGFYLFTVASKSGGPNTSGIVPTIGLVGYRQVRIP